MRKSARRAAAGWPCSAPPIGCAILLIAGGYFGLRAMNGGGGTLVASGQPPVIKADHGPNKVAPPQQAGGDQSADGQKLIYDRVGGDPSGNERVVSSQEEPVDPSQAAQPQAQPRVILPPTGGSGPAPSPSAPAPLGAMPSASPPQAQQPSTPVPPIPPSRSACARSPCAPTARWSTARPRRCSRRRARRSRRRPASRRSVRRCRSSSYAQDDAASSSAMPANVPLPPTRVAAAPVASPTTAAPAAPAASRRGGVERLFRAGGGAAHPG